MGSLRHQGRTWTAMAVQQLRAPFGGAVGSPNFVAGPFHEPQLDQRVIPCWENRQTPKVRRETHSLGPFPPSRSAGAPSRSPCILAKELAALRGSRATENGSWVQPLERAKGFEPSTPTLARRSGNYARLRYRLPRFRDVLFSLLLLERLCANARRCALKHAPGRLHTAYSGVWFGSCKQSGKGNAWPS